MPVSVRAFLPATSASWNSLLSSVPAVRAACAASRACRTCRWMSGSPRIMESMPAATEKRWAAAAPSR